MIRVVAVLPEWTSIYYVKVDDQGMKCNLCETVLNVDAKSLKLLDHMKTDHKDIYLLHKDNPDATVGFRIEFLQVNVEKENEVTDDIVFEELSNDTTDSEAQRQLLEEAAAKAEEGQVAELVYIDDFQDKKKQARMRTRDSSKPPRKRSWVWKYFEKMTHIIYRCKLCNVVLSIKGFNTNNMNRHVKSRHPTVYKNEMVKAKTETQTSLSVEEVETPFAIKTEEIYASDKSVDTTETESSSQKHRRSWIWSYFDRVSSTHGQCKLCKRHISHGGNATGNMNRHLKMIHHKTAFDSSWVWKVFQNTDENWYTCKICQFRCPSHDDADKSLTSMLLHLKLEHGVISGDQIITSTDADEN